MKDNRYLIQFCKLPLSIHNMVRWKECNDHQNEVIKWCREHINEKMEFPYWQLGGRSGGFCIPDVSEDYDDFIPHYYEGIFIMREDDRVAFTLRFPFKDWT